MQQLNRVYIAAYSAQYSADINIVYTCDCDQLLVSGPHPRVRVPLAPPGHHAGGGPGQGEEQLLRRAEHGVVRPLPELRRLLGLLRSV